MNFDYRFLLILFAFLHLSIATNVELNEIPNPERDPVDLLPADAIDLESNFRETPPRRFHRFKSSFKKFGDFPSRFMRKMKDAYRNHASLSKAVVPDQLTISQPNDASLMIPRTFKPKKVLFLFSGVCQLRCAYTRNKAYHGMTTGDLRLMAEAYQAATRWDGIGINAFLTVVQLGIFTASIVLAVITGPLSLLGLSFSTLDLVNIHGPNTVHYSQIIYYLRDTLKKVVGEKEFRKLKKVKYYKSEQGAIELQEWLERQRVRLNIPVAPPSVRQEDIPQPDAETLEQIEYDLSLPPSMQGLSVSDSSYTREEIFASRNSCPSCSKAAKTDWIAVTV